MVLQKDVVGSPQAGGPAWHLRDRIGRDRSPDCDIESLACLLRETLELNRSCRHRAVLCRVSAEEEGNADDSSELIVIRKCYEAGWNRPKNKLII